MAVASIIGPHLIQELAPESRPGQNRYKAPRSTDHGGSADWNETARAYIWARLAVLAASVMLQITRARTMSEPNKNCPVFSGGAPDWKNLTMPAVTPSTPSTIKVPRRNPTPFNH